MARKDKIQSPESEIKKGPKPGDMKDDQKNREQKGSKYTAEREDVAQGYGSSQRGEDKNVGPLDADLDALPSESRGRRGSGSSTLGT